MFKTIEVNFIFDGIEYKRFIKIDSTEFSLINISIPVSTPNNFGVREFKLSFTGKKNLNNQEIWAPIQVH